MYVCTCTGLGITKIGSLVMLFHDVTDVKSGGEHAVDMLRNTLRKQTPYTLTHQSRTLLHVTLWRCFSKDALTGTAQPLTNTALSRVGRAVSALGLSLKGEPGATGDGFQNGRENSLLAPTA